MNHFNEYENVIWPHALFKTLSFKAGRDCVYRIRHLLIPFLLALFLCGVELSRFILIVQKVKKPATTIADVVAQTNGSNGIVYSSDLKNILTAAKQVMEPYDSDITQLCHYQFHYAKWHSVTAILAIDWQYTGRHMDESQPGWRCPRPCPHTDGTHS